MLKQDRAGQREFFNNNPAKDLIWAFSDKRDGNTSLIYGNTEDALKNRKEFLGAIGIDYRDLVCAKQVHGSRVEYIRESDKGRGALTYEGAVTDTDAFITDKKNLPLAVFTADCLSIFVYSADIPSIGLIHAGWRSTRAEIAPHTINLMQKRFNIRPEDLYVGFGPSIRVCCYEVDKEFRGSDASLIKKNNRYYFDLIGANKKQLLNLGIKEKNIFDSGICTSCQNHRFFSYRKEGNNCGRMVAVAMLL